MENLIFSMNATLPVFLLMVLGYVLYLLHVVTRDFARQMNSFVFRIALPFQLFSDMAQQDFGSAWDGKFVLFCFIATLLSILISALAARLVLGKDRSRRGEFIQVSYRSSAAILGVAFIQNIYGEGHTAMAALMMIGAVPLYNIFAVIILMVTAAKGSADPASGRRLARKTAVGVITNPILIGILLGFVWSLLHLPLPSIPQKVVSDIGKMATPMGLIAMGALFDPHAAGKEIGPAVCASVMKLVVLEAVFLPIAVMLGFRSQQLVALTVMLGSASTVACYVMATGMGHEGTLTSSTVMITTAGCSFTLTMWLYILRSMALI